MMRSRKRVLLILALVSVGVLSAAASAQDAARLHFERLAGLENIAHDSVEVNVDGKMLALVKGIATSAKINDPDARKVAQAISGLRGIYVRVYNFAKENEYNIADVDAL